MEKVLTPADILHFFQDVKDLYKETDRKFQDTERLIKQQSLDTDRKFQDTDKKFQSVSAK